METTQNTPAEDTYRPGQPIEAQYGPSGWSPATYAAFRHGQHLIRTEDGDTLTAHPDKIRPNSSCPATGRTASVCTDQTHTECSAGQAESAALDRRLARQLS